MRLDTVSVHPRLRGELSGSIVQFDRRTGSSPLTRGTLAKTPVSLDDTRFIPAYAGNSLIDTAVNLYEAVHPRLRGELDGLVRA